jgi:hypothetical protein
MQLTLGRAQKVYSWIVALFRFLPGRRVSEIATEKKAWWVIRVERRTEEREVKPIQVFDAVPDRRTSGCDKLQLCACQALLDWNKPPVDLCDY